jgi:hypothetical protein
MGTPKTLSGDDEIDLGCVFILDESRTCGGPCKEASPYCRKHHALCHVAYGSTGESKRLREVEALAKAVGGRRSRADGGPSRQFLRRLERVARFSCE